MWYKKVSILKGTTVQNQIGVSITVAAAVLLAIMSVTTDVPNQASAQIIPSSTDQVQNGTASNITQLATILPVSDQPITPASTAESSDGSSNSDSNSDSNGDHHNDHHNDHGGGGASASAGGGGASASAG